MSISLARLNARGRRLWLLFLLLAGLPLLGVGPQASAAPSAHGRRPAPGWASVIAQFRGGRVDGGLSPTESRDIQALGAYVYRTLPLIHSAAVRVPNKNRARFAALPFVRHISPDSDVHKSDEFTVGATGADQAFSAQGLTGAGVTVAVLDSGVRATPADLADPSSGASRVVAAVNFAPDTDSADDLCGHGTHVAGIIAGNGAASAATGDRQTFYGIARGASIVSVRVLNAQGQGAVSDVVKALGWIVANKDQYHIRIVNLSLGHPVGESYTTDPLCQAVEAAWQAGLVVVCAGGNGGRASDQRGLLSMLLESNEGYGTAYGSIQSPGNDPSVITVGALKQGSSGPQIATYSARGPSRLDLVLKPDLVAPGNRIISLKAAGSALDTLYGATNSVPLGAYIPHGGAQPSPDYFVLSGTSMAAPVVSGAAALLLQADPTLTPDTVKARLMASADKMTGDEGLPDPVTYGAGALDIPAALQSHCVASRSALSPVLWRDSSGQVHMAWSGLVGADGALWGAGLFGPESVWGSQVIWGEDTLSESQVIWGESVWSDQVIWGESTGAADLSTTALQGE